MLTIIVLVCLQWAHPSTSQFASLSQVPCPSEGTATFPYYRCYNQYYQCEDGEACLERCPEGTGYQQSSGTCVSTEKLLYPGTDLCGEDPLPTCPTDSDEPVLFDHKKCCNLFYICSNSTAVVEMCPYGTIFDAENGTCVEPTPDNECDTNICELDELPACEEEFYLKVNECSYFYHCSNGIPYLMKCPANLRLNISMVQCDYPSDTDYSCIPA